MGCSSLKSINIPKSCTKIERQAFHYCSALETVTIPGNVKTIGQEAFGDAGLKEVIIEDSNVDLTLLPGCFNSYSLTYAELPDRIIKIGSEDDDFADAFPSYDEDDGYELVIKCSKGSVAEAYAKENGYKCKY